MIRVIGNIPKGKFGIALSGGIDSMACLHFLLNGKYRPEVIYFNHNTDHGDQAEIFVKEYCQKHGLTVHIGRTDIKPLVNKEKVWSNLRYQYFATFDFPIITCHHLDDCVETYIFTMLRGFQSVIPYTKGNVIRPFLLNDKKTLMEWVNKNDVPYIEDESNFQLDHIRNRIRHNIVPEALIVNPGLKSVIKKMIVKK